MTLKGWRVVKPQHNQKNLAICVLVNIYSVSKISQELLYLQSWNFVHMTSMTSGIVGKKIEAMGPGP